MNRLPARHLAALALAGAVFVAAPPAVAGPEEEELPSEFVIDYPGYYVVEPAAERRIVARVRFRNVGQLDSAGLDVCAVLPRGFRDATVDGRRERVRVTRRGSRICWYHGVVSEGETGRAVVRATAPRRARRYVTKVSLIAVVDAAVPGETISRRGAVRVRR